MKTGYLIVFKGKGLLSKILGTLLKWKRPDWDGWGWHTAIAVEYHKGKGWMIAEALSGGVQYSWLSLPVIKSGSTYISGDGRIFRIVPYFTNTIHATELRRIIADCIGCKYDSLVYIWTIMQMFIPWFPRIINMRYTCWEFTFWVCRMLGKPIQHITKYPNIADIPK